MSYWQLLLLILPVFALIGIGVFFRRMAWMTAEADGSLLKMVVNFLYPCLVFENVLNNPSLRDPSNLGLGPLIAAGMTALSIVFGLWVARVLGLTQGHGLRTFGFASGINNYGYIPIPLMTALFGTESLGVLLVYNVGCEVAIWTVGILVLSGLSLKEGWRRLLNPMVLSLVLGLAGNLTGLGARMPDVVTSVIHQCAVCAVPLGLILIGGTLEQYFNRPRELFDARVLFGSVGLRLGLYPLVFLLLARYLPATDELKRVLVVQAGMPAGILPIVIAKHYGGHPLTAVRVVIGTTVVGVLLIPLWLKFGMAWIL